MTLLTVALQAPLSMDFFRQEYWSGLPFPSPGDLPHPGIDPRSPALQADALLTELLGFRDQSNTGWVRRAICFRDKLRNIGGGICKNAVITQ